MEIIILAARRLEFDPLAGWKHGITARLFIQCLLKDADRPPARLKMKEETLVDSKHLILLSWDLRSHTHTVLLFHAKSAFTVRMY